MFSSLTAVTVQISVSIEPITIFCQSQSSVTITLSFPIHMTFVEVLCN